MSEPLICSAGGIPYNKPHLDAKDAEINRLRAAIRDLREQRDHFRDELLKIASAANAAALY